jgi:hypothetical protein
MIGTVEGGPATQLRRAQRHVWFLVYEIYTYIGVEHDVCEVIKNYAYIRALAVPIDIINESYEKYLMTTARCSASSSPSHERNVERVNRWR